MASKRITIGEPLTPIEQNRLRAALKLRIIHAFEKKLAAFVIPVPLSGTTVEAEYKIVLDEQVVKECAEEVGVTLQSMRVIEEEVPPVDRTARTTLHGTPVEDIPAKHAAQPVGMHDDYIVLTEEERAKGFSRPVRRSYKHVGPAGPKYPLRDLTTEEHERYDKFKYFKFEKYPDDHSSGRFWTEEQLANVGKGCGTVTTMGLALAETYARDRSFYGATFCVGCRVHLPIGEHGEFVWEGTNERVGT
jgi:hypothetical protein